MQPEPGDRNIHVSRADVAAAARTVGIVPGDTMIFHSSLSSLGTVDGGPDTVIDGFLDAVGPGGTVAVPTLCNWAPDEQSEVFTRWDPATSPSYVGRITEHLRHRPDAVRSDNATHSVAAIGARAVDLTAGHGASGPRLGPFGELAFCVASPWQRLYDWNAAYCLIGVTYHVATIVHFVESRLTERALAGASNADRERVIGWMKPGVWPWIRIEDRERIEAMLHERGLERHAKLGSATLRCGRTRTIVDEWVAAVEREPEAWLPEEFLAWRAEIGGKPGE